MKFLLKITIFMALILISKITKESEETASGTDKIKPSTSTLATYSQQVDALSGQEEAGEKRALIIY